MSTYDALEVPMGGRLYNIVIQESICMLSDYIKFTPSVVTQADNQDQGRSSPPEACLKASQSASTSKQVNRQGDSTKIVLSGMAPAASTMSVSWSRPSSSAASFSASRAASCGAVADPAWPPPPLLSASVQAGEDGAGTVRGGVGFVELVVIVVSDEQLCCGPCLCHGDTGSPVVVWMKGSRALFHSRQTLK